jgi:hypothetical protein
VDAISIIARVREVTEIPDAGLMRSTDGVMAGLDLAIKADGNARSDAPKRLKLA